MSESTHSLTIPTIHLNGSGRENLTENLEDAYEALDDAYKALRYTAPNGRDYYPQGAGVLERAAEEHMARLRKIHDVMAEIETVLKAIG
jgi:hypothetical protein